MKDRFSDDVDTTGAIKGAISGARTAAVAIPLELARQANGRERKAYDCLANPAGRQRELRAC